MSLEINLEDFPNLLSVFEEIELRGWRKTFLNVDPELHIPLKQERKPRSFTTLEGKQEARNTDPEKDKMYKLDGKPRPSSVMEEGTAVGGKAGAMHKSDSGPRTAGPMDPGKHKRLNRCASDLTGYTLKVAPSRLRIRSAPPPPCLATDRDTLLADRRFTDAARNLSDEELALLYEDIVKPLDFYAMLHERRKQSQEKE